MLQLLDAPRSAFDLIPKLPKLAGNFITHKDTDIGDEIVERARRLRRVGRLPAAARAWAATSPRGSCASRTAACRSTGRRTARSKEYFERVRDVSKAVAEELGGTFLDNPIWLLSRVVTVHALGGCPMGRDDDEGVVDAYGRVYNYPGLHIADGSVMPGPGRPEPEPHDRRPRRSLRRRDPRGHERTHRDRTRRHRRPATTRATRRRGRAAAPASDPASLEFTEKMRGFITFGEDDYDKGFRQGKKSKTKCMFHVTVLMDDIERFIEDRAAPGLDHRPRRSATRSAASCRSCRAGSTSSSTPTRTARSASS